MFWYKCAIFKGDPNANLKISCFVFFFKLTFCSAWKYYTCTETCCTWFFNIAVIKTVHIVGSITVKSDVKLHIMNKFKIMDPKDSSCKNLDWNIIRTHLTFHLLDGFGGLVVSMLASGTQVYAFKPGRSRWIFTGVKILSMLSSGGEVKESVPCPSFAECKRT